MKQIAKKKIDPATTTTTTLKNKQTNDHLCDVCLFVSISIYMQMQMDDNSVDDDDDNDRLLFSAIFFFLRKINLKIHFAIYTSE